MKKKQKMTIEKIKEEAEKSALIEAPKYEKYQIDSDVAKMLEVEELKQDPKKFKAVMAALKKKKKAINSIADLHSAHDEMEDEE